MASMILNALRQIAEFIYQHGMILIITGLILVVINYFLAMIPMYLYLWEVCSPLIVAFNGLLTLTVWLRVRTHFSQG